MNLKVKRGTDFMCGNNKTRKNCRKKGTRKNYNYRVIGLHD